MRLGRYSFSPGLVPTLVTAALLPLLAGLGVWQLGRAEEKRSIEQTVARQVQAPPLEIDAERWRLIRHSADAAGLAHRRVVMSGRFQGERQYLLDNRTHDGVAGFQVLTAFKPEGAAGGVLVNRGWIPLGPRRDQPPELPVPAATLRIRATFDGSREPPPLLGSAGYEQPQWPKIVQRIELGTISEQLEFPLLPLIALLDPDAPAGFERAWKPYYGISVQRHQAYAFQWFALAIALALIYILVNLRRTDRD